MGNFFRDRSIGFKMLAGILLVIGIGAGSSLFGLFSIGRIGVGLDTVARDNMPLLNQMSEINQQQLEQSIIFERGMQLALIISSTEDGYQRVSELKTKYEESGKAITEAINKFIAITERVAQESSGQQREEFNIYAQTMKSVNEEYVESQKKIGTIFDYMLQGRIDDAGPMVEAAHNEGEELRNKLVGVHRKLVTSANAAAEESRALKQAAYATVSVLMIASVIIGLMFALFITRGITVPLRRTLRALEDIAEGEGDLTQRLEVAGKDELGQLGQNFNHFVDKIHGVLVNVKGAAEYVVEGSRGISNSNEHLLSRADEQRNRLSETSSSMDELTEAVKRNADSARQASDLAAANQERAMAGADIVMSAVDAVSDINASSDKIADIISTIDGIAFQTNLLALNAAVEAARAGEQGRGFAVVATEVRSLAQRSAEAAKEIKQLIEDSLTKVKAGTQLVDESGKALEEIIVGTKRVTDLIADIAEISQEQASGISSVNSSIVRMDQMTDENSTLVRETATASHAMRDQVEALVQQISFFRLEQGSPSLRQADASPRLESA